MWAEIQKILGELKRLDREIQKLKLFDIPKKSEIGSGGGGGGSGDVTGPGSSTDHAIARFNGTSGKTLENSLSTVDDAGSINIPTGETYDINGSPHTHVLADHDHSGDAGDGGQFAIENLTTAETITTKRLAPDGSGGVEFVAGGGGTDLGWINVKDYGALGDGTTDDTDAIDDAIAAMTSGGVLYFPVGSYVSSGGHTLSQPTIVLGCGMGSGNAAWAPSKITCTSATAYLFTITAHGCQFRDIALQNTAGSTPTAGAAIRVTTGDLARYINVNIDNFYDNLVIEDGFAWLIQGCVFWRPYRYGVEIRHDDLGDNGDNNIIGCDFLANTHDSTAAIHYTSGGGLKISNIKINGGNGGNFYDGIDLTAGAVTVDFFVSNSSIENVDHNGINIYSAGSRWDNIMLNNIEFMGIGAYPISIGSASLGAINNVLINNCTVWDSNFYLIGLNKINRVLITGCQRSDGGVLVNQTDCTNVIIATGHNQTTLDANADTLLSLTDQVLGLDTQSANYIFGGPSSGPAAVPGFRSLVAADIPNISATKITSGTISQDRLGTGSGGSGQKFLADNQTFKTVVGSGEILIEDGSSAPPVMLTNEAQDDFLYEG